MRGCVACSSVFLFFPHLSRDFCFEEGWRMNVIGCRARVDEEEADPGVAEADASNLALLDFPSQGLRFPDNAGGRAGHI